MTPSPSGPSDGPGWLLPLATALVEALPRLHGAAADPLVGEVITALTTGLQQGELNLALTGPPPAGVDEADWPQGHLEALAASPLTAAPWGPLVLDEDQVLWRRWHGQRQNVLTELVERARRPWTTGALPAGDLPAGIGDGQQQRAVEALTEHGLVVLEGGPGTGKTTTVALMLTALLRQEPNSRIHLAAPTGKATARLRNATGGRWPCTTLHRLLESRAGRFGRDRNHPLALDVVVVDEASMVDLGLMAALLEALPAAARLVLVGDPDQLPPIDPGPVLLELQRPGLRKALGGAVVTLRTTYRNGGAIAAVAASLRDGASRGGVHRPAAADPLAMVRTQLQGLTSSDNLAWLEASIRSLPPLLLQRLSEHHQTLAHRASTCDPGDPATISALLRCRDGLLVLSPLRMGRWGVDAIHRALLGERATGGAGGWPIGTPVLCTRNLVELGLANGDLGVLIGAADPQDGPAPRRLLFGDGIQDPVVVHPAQLAGALEPALALTVHKAQGSEAEEVIVLLPPGDRQDSRLLYTALTRARERALLITARETPSINVDISSRRSSNDDAQVVRSKFNL